VSAITWAERRSHHPAREPQQVADRCFIVLVLPKSRAADGGSEFGAVNRHEAAIVAFNARRDTLIALSFKFRDLHDVRQS
jgi:hypothetical protein